MSESKYVLGLDVSTKVIGIALYEDLGNRGKLILLHHVAPKSKLKVSSKTEEMFLKADCFTNEFLVKYKDLGIHKVIIEEPLLGSNNVNTVATLLRFNGMISKSCYDILGVVPVFISSYNARAYGFPELMQKRTHDKKGEPYSKSEMNKKEPVLFGAYPFDVDKKRVIWDKVADLEPQISWLYDKKGVLMKENMDMTDALCACLGKQRMDGCWV